VSQHAGDENFTVKAGDRMPYFLVDGASVYDRLHEAKAHFLVFSAEHNENQSLPAEFENRYATFIDLHQIALHPNVAEAFGTEGSFCVFLRPDNYIGFLSTDVSLSAIDSYLKDFLGVRILGL
jgi:hypothetical protein